MLGEDKFKFESEFKLRVGGDRASFRTRGWWMETVTCDS